MMSLTYVNRRRGRWGYRKLSTNQQATIGSPIRLCQILFCQAGPTCTRRHAHTCRHTHTHIYIYIYISFTYVYTHARTQTNKQAKKTSLLPHFLSMSLTVFLFQVFWSVLFEARCLIKIFASCSYVFFDVEY